jgi:hypothetical protein
VDLTGNAHIVLHVTVDNAGGLHINVQASGTGTPSGANYQGGAELNGDLNLNSGGAGEVTVNLSIRLIGQGQTPDLRGHLLFHVTSDANGVLTAEFLKFTPDICK